MEANPSIGLEARQEASRQPVLAGPDVLAAGYSDVPPLVDGRLVLVKRFVDIVGSLVLMILLSPLLLAVGLAIVLTSPGAAIFSQPRVGRGGREFKCYKFRTMILDAERELHKILTENAEFRAEWEKAQKLASDPRVTKTGAFLRKTSLDELPQLINVLLGDMSLVGPRPALPSQLTLYRRSAKWYCAIRPGMTGLWQVTARGNHDFRRRIALDCYYVRHLSLAMDVKILLKTVTVVLSGRGAS